MPKDGLGQNIQTAYGYNSYKIEFNSTASGLVFDSHPSYSSVGVSCYATAACFVRFDSSTAVATNSGNYATASANMYIPPQVPIDIPVVNITGLNVVEAALSGSGVLYVNEWLLAPNMGF